MIANRIKLFMQWWGDNLYRGLPGFLRGLFRVNTPSLDLGLLPNNQLAVSWTQEGRSKECGRYALDSSFEFSRIAKKHARSRKYHLDVSLQPDQVLRLQHSFPEAVRDNIKQVVAYQLDRLTPFSMDSAYFDAQVARYDKSNKSLLADIYVAPRAGVERVMEHLQGLGVPPIDGVSVAGSKARLTRGLQTSKTAPLAWSKIPLYFFLLALVAALAAPIAYQQRRLDQINEATQEVKQQAATQIEVRDKLLAAGDALTFLDQQRKASPVMLDVVEQLSSEIPAHTWLERLEISGREIQVRGESTDALSLIDTLEESPHFAAVSFKSPVTRNTSTGKDKFHLQATVELAP